MRCAAPLEGGAGTDHPLLSAVRSAAQHQPEGCLPHVQGLQVQGMGHQQEDADYLLAVRLQEEEDNAASQRVAQSLARAVQADRRSY